MEKQDRSQRSFLPECVEDYVSEDNPVRVIDAFVDSLDMDELGFRRAKPADTGRPAYDPRDLLKLYLYGYLNRIRSSRTPDAQAITAAIQDLRQRQEKYETLLTQLTESGQTQILTTDPEARRMHSKDGFHCCYNVQTAVDSGNHRR